MPCCLWSMCCIHEEEQSHWCKQRSSNEKYQCWGKRQSHPFCLCMNIEMPRVNESETLYIMRIYKSEIYIYIIWIYIYINLIGWKTKSLQGKGSTKALKCGQSQYTCLVYLTFVFTCTYEWNQDNDACRHGHWDFI